MSGKGYRLVASRTKKSAPPSEVDMDIDIRTLKKAYWRYFWPELLFEGIIKTLKRREKEKLLKTLSELQDKKEVTKELNRYLREIYKNK